MEINRKTYSEIIKLLKSKNITSDDALEITDEICILLERINTISVLWNWLLPLPNSTPQTILIPNTTWEVKTIPLIRESTWPRKFKPFEKVAWGYVDGNWKFTPVPPWKWIGWVSDSNGKIDWTITQDLIY